MLLCMVIALDGFHMVNHTNNFCVGALNPWRFPQLNGINTQSCEQTNVSLNRHRNHLRQKSGSAFRFFLLLSSDLKNATKLRKPRSVEDDDREPRQVRNRAYYEKKEVHAKAVAATKTVPNVPPSYLGTTDESNIQTHVNPVLFKQDWDTELSTKVPVVQSRLEGAKYKYKHEVRRLLMDRAVQKEVAVHVPLVSGVFCQSESEPESD